MLAPDVMDPIADAFERALTTPDAEALDALLAPDFHIWYNFTNASLDKREAIAFFQSYFGPVRVRFSDRRRIPMANGWVQQHRVHAQGPAGLAIEGLPACIVFTLRGDRIVRIEEYLDSSRSGDFDASTMRQA